jgi:N-acetylated-alpha-linked acidic dipeptidase
LALALSALLLWAKNRLQVLPETSAAKRKQTEQKFDAVLSAEKIGATIKDLASKPHHLGSAGGKAVAENILARFKSYGWDATIETYQVLFPTPKTRSLEMVSPTSYKALLKSRH